MEKLTDIVGADCTVARILAIASAHRNQLGSSDTATFYFVWLDGYYRDAMGVNKNVLGKRGTRYGRGRRGSGRACLGCAQAP